MFHYLHTLLNQLWKLVVVVDRADNDKEDLVQDPVAVLYSFSARMYGLRRSQRRTERLLAYLEKESVEGSRTSVTPS